MLHVLPQVLLQVLLQMLPQGLLYGLTQVMVQGLLQVPMHMLPEMLQGALLHGPPEVLPGALRYVPPEVLPGALRHVPPEMMPKILLRMLCHSQVRIYPSCRCLPRNAGKKAMNVALQVVGRKGKTNTGKQSRQLSQMLLKFSKKNHGMASPHLIFQGQ